MSAGCAGEQSAVSADCAAAVRRDGIVYIEAGFTSRPASPSGQAQRADCRDVGPDAPGVVFSDEFDVVSVVAFKGLDTRRVLGVREGATVRVLVAEGVAAETVMDDLAGGGDVDLGGAGPVGP